MLGAGRIRKEDKIDNSVGIVLNKKVGDKIQRGEVLAYIHSNDHEKMLTAKKEVSNIIRITENEIDTIPTIIEVIE